MAFTALEARWDSSEVAKWMNTDMEGAMIRALRRSGTETIRKVRVIASRHIRQRKAVRADRVRRGLVMVFPTSARTLESLVWRLGFSGKAIPVMAYGRPRQVRAGVSVTINKGQRTVIKSAFIATMRQGHTGVFKRKGKARLPIKELLTTRISDVGQDAGFLEGLGNQSVAIFGSAFQRLMALELQRRNT